MGSTKVQAPPPRDYYKEMSDTIRAQIDLAPEMISAEKRLLPQWQQLQMETMRGQANNLKSFYREVMGDSADLMTQYGTTYANAFAPIARSARTSYESSLGGGEELQNNMRTQAMSGLNAGSALTPEMMKQAQQMGRAASTSRGLAYSNQGIGAEVLSGYNLGIQREDRARLFANTVLGNDVTMANNAYQQYGSPLVQSGMAALSPMGLAGMATQYNSNLGPSYLQPESQYSANLNSANQNMEMQARVATAQNNAAMWGSAMDMVGSFAPKPATPSCWVAREVYGNDNPNWMVFRHWLYTEAPKWFKELYLEEGERFAKFISNKPLLKSLIKMAMDTIVKPRLKVLTV